MGIEYVILGLWTFQAIAVVVLASRSAMSKRWFATAGALMGGVVGFVPLVAFRGPAIWPPLVLIVTVSAIALTVVFGAARRWTPLLLVSLILTLPLGYYVFGHTVFPPRSNLLLTSLAVMSELAILLAPFICALAAMEMFGWLDRAVARWRSA